MGSCIRSLSANGRDLKAESEPQPLVCTHVNGSVTANSLGNKGTV